MLKKTYQLKTPYPGLPSSWKKDMLIYTSPCGIGYEPDFMIPLHKHIPKNDVENFPEFWTLVEEEQDYEIVKMVSKHTRIIYDIYKNPDNELAFDYITLKYWEENHNNLWYEIYAVKSKKTGVVISIGNEFKYNLFNRDHKENHKVFRIDSIWFEEAASDKGKRILSFNHNHITLGRWLELDKLSIVDTSEYRWGVHIPTWREIDQMALDITLTYNEALWLWFDNKPERDEWVYNEKPVISRRELFNLAGIVTKNTCQVLEVK